MIAVAVCFCFPVFIGFNSYLTSFHGVIQSRHVLRDAEATFFIPSYDEPSENDLFAFALFSYGDFISPAFTAVCILCAYMSV